MPLMTLETDTLTMVDGTPRHPALVVGRKRIVAEGVVELTLRATDGAELPSWSPGTHIDLEVAPGLVRQYSLCGSPVDRKTWTIAVLREPNSRGGSRHIHDHLDARCTVRVLAVRNLFELEPAARYLFIAGGIGITPILPMIDAAERAAIPWQLHYGGRSLRSMAFVKRLRTTYGDKVIVRPEDDEGVLDLAVILGEPAAGLGVYCCGPPGLIAAVEQHCSNWPWASLHVERFTAPVSPRDSTLDAAFDVILKNSGLRVSVPPDKTILEVLRDDHGIEIVSGCEQGICGTCETRVIDGIPDHRDSVLTTKEQVQNQTMMVCISRSKSNVITLDL
jgi:ferredoxin-NADP reductase